MTAVDAPLPPSWHPFEESQLVPEPRATRRIAFVIAMLVLALPVILLVSPWRQNIPASGRVTALNPLDRLQSIQAPVSGRLSVMHIQEGSRVEKDQPLLELADLDPLYADRLRQQLELATQKVTAARDAIAFYDRQIASLEQELTQMVEIARAEFDAAAEKVRVEEQELIAANADYEQKQTDRLRHEALFAKKLVSELDMQKAVASALRAEARSSAVSAELARAENERHARQTRIEQVRNGAQAKIESARSTREDARGKLAAAEKEYTDAETRLGRQSTQTVHAPRDGVVLRIHAAARSELIKAGDPILDFVPIATQLAVELWVRGNDAPLITPGREVRLQFEGWPAVQFAGWPSVAVGTFGGLVQLVDGQDDGKGRFRVLVIPDPDDEPWPDLFYARFGTRANGWFLLDEVSLGYELWRQLNAFPPSLSRSPGSVEPESGGKVDNGDQLDEK